MKHPQQQAVQPGTALEQLYRWERECPDHPYLHQPVDGELRSYSRGEVAGLARRLAGSLLAQGFAPGTRIGLLAKNSAEWFIVDLAIQLAGMVSVPIFATAGPATIRYICDHAELPLIFLGKLDEPAPQLAAIPEHIATVALPYPDIEARHSWAEFTAAAPYAESPVPAAESLATIIYTSGSTGDPKGVMHSHHSLCWSAAMLIRELDFRPEDRALSYLPLAHITERVFVEYASFFCLSQVWFTESLDTFQTDIQRCAPTLFLSVPRLWTKFQLAILAQVPQKKLSLLLRIPLLKQRVKHKIKAGLGLHKLRQAGSGSAPIAPALLHWFHKLDIDICEGWGMTENAAYGTSCYPFCASKIGSIGSSYEGTELRIADSGEIQVRGPCLMQGYYLEPERTAAAFTADGFLKTGDRGEMDAQGQVRITGRLKEIFKTAKGKYVAPAPIEAKFMANPTIEQVCVTGNNLPQPIALVVLSEAAQQRQAERVRKELEDQLRAINAGLERHQQLDRILICPQAWTTENELLTPTLKVRRHRLEQALAEQISARYRELIVILKPIS